jgi:hypothetical protein
MVKAGDETVNPVTGLRMIFRKTANETNGELLQFDWIGKPSWKAGPLYVHSYQEERFEVISGTLGSHITGVERVHEAGKWPWSPPGPYIRRGTLAAATSKCTSWWICVWAGCARRPP